MSEPRNDELPISFMLLLKRVFELAEPDELALILPEIRALNVKLCHLVVRLRRRAGEI